MRPARRASDAGVTLHALEPRTLLSGTGRVKYRHRHPAIVPPPPPQVPQALTAQATAPRSVTVTFTDPARDATRFVIQRSVAGSRFTTVATVGPPPKYRAAVYVDNDVAPDVAYRYRVMALGRTGSSAYADPVAVVTPDLHNLLFFGNSFTLYHDLPSLVAEIAADDGHATPHVVEQVSAGWTLRDHLRKLATDGAADVIDAALPPGQSWDDVILQDFSTRATSVTAKPVYGDPGGFLADLKAIVAQVRANSPAAHAVLTETWARGPLSPFYPGSFPSPSAMQTDVLAHYTAAAAALNALYPPHVNTDPTAEVATAGEAWRAAGEAWRAAGEAWRAAGWPRDLYDGPDEYHPSAKGSALAAMIVYRALYHDDVADIPAPAAANVTGPLGLSAADWMSLTTIADAVTT